MNSFILFASFSAVLLSGCSSVQSARQPVAAPPSSPPSQTSAPPVTTTASGQFVAVGNMTTPRAMHVAILLPNGKVLIAGGVTVGYPILPPLSSAELYDPSTHTFTPTGSMAVPRSSPGAVLLANGKVFVVGGSQDLSAEIYDPATGAFTFAGNMVPTGAAPSESAFNSNLPTLLNDGEVLVEGVNAQIYDPVIGIFSLTGPYTDAEPLWNTSTTLLKDGRVLLTGYTGCFQSCKSGAAELYDPGTNKFSSAGPLAAWGNVNTATLLTNDKVLFVGSDEMDGPAVAELYDPIGGTFTSAGSTVGTHEFSAAVRLSDGTVLISGGQVIGGSGSSQADLYDPSTGMFMPAGYMNAGRHNHTATLLQDGTVLIAGGWTGWPASTNSAEIYKP